jgi:two-component system sensor kinase
MSDFPRLPPDVEGQDERIPNLIHRDLVRDVRIVRRLAEAPGRETYLAEGVDGSQLIVKHIDTNLLSDLADERLQVDAIQLAGDCDALLGPWLAVERHETYFKLIRRFLPRTCLAERLKQQGPLSVAETLTVARTLAKSLTFAHNHGVLHRAIRPTNVITPEEAPYSQSVLTDFGWCEDRLLQNGATALPVVAAYYLSPEQSGALEYELGAASDLYSLGVLIYECLTGSPPFVGSTAGAVLMQHMTARVPELRRTGLAIPRLLDEMIQRLMRKDPRDRYQSSSALLVDLDAMIESVEQGVEEPIYVLGSADCRRTLTEPDFVGRVQELEAVDGQIRRTINGQGGVIFQIGRASCRERVLRDV